MICIGNDGPGQSWIPGFLALLSICGKPLGGSWRTVCRFAWKADQRAAHDQIKASVELVWKRQGDACLPTGPVDGGRGSTPGRSLFSLHFQGCSLHFRSVNGQTFSVVIGSCEDTYNLALRLMIQRLCGQSTRCVFSAVARLDDLLAQANRQPFDLAILILNDLLAPETARQNRIEQTIAAIAELKARCPISLIALSGYADGPTFPARVRQAGADEFMFLPLQWPECRAALSRCLRISGAARRGR